MITVKNTTGICEQRIFSTYFFSFFLSFLGGYLALPYKNQYSRKYRIADGEQQN
jgi:hypothetical protein